MPDIVYMTPDVSNVFVLVMNVKPFLKYPTKNMGSLFLSCLRDWKHCDLISHYFAKPQTFHFSRLCAFLLL